MLFLVEWYIYAFDSIQLMCACLLDYTHKISVDKFILMGLAMTFVGQENPINHFQKQGKDLLHQFDLIYKSNQIDGANLSLASEND